MADTNHSSANATTIEAARLVGARECLEAMRELERAFRNGTGARETGGAFYSRCAADASAFAASLGPLTPQQEGAIAVLAELALVGALLDETPNLAPDRRGPFSAMTEGERAAACAEFLDDEFADNVVAIADRIPAR